MSSILLYFRQVGDAVLAIDGRRLQSYFPQSQIQDMLYGREGTPVLLTLQKEYGPELVLLLRGADLSPFMNARGLHVCPVRVDWPLCICAACVHAMKNVRVYRALLVLCEGRLIKC